MSWLTILILTVCALLICLLLARIRVIGEFGPDCSILGMKWLFVGVTGDFKHREITYSVSGFRIYKQQLKDFKIYKTVTKTEPIEPPAEKIKIKPKPSLPKITDQPSKTRVKAPTDDRSEPDMRQKLETLLKIWHERHLIILLIKRLVKAALRFIRSARTDRLDINIDLSTPDPCLTGVLFGTMQPFIPLFPEPARINIAPDFLCSSTSLDLSCAFSMRLITLITLISYTLARLPWLRIYKARRVIFPPDQD